MACTDATRMRLEFWFSKNRSTLPLEPVCCKKRPKIVPDQLLVLWNKGPLKVLNGTKLTLDDHGNSLDSFIIGLESFGFFGGPLLHKPVTGQELCFADYYSKPALPITIK